ncbi:MAG: PLP-dependent aspartate aminotransferase family protein [Rhodospirillales bacterium]|nr:PLP-dependent aspartate aminotransferase family protein [Rhodospirillales bacterium]MDH3919214.1 PLP-dependent aspartate aminotransferase family protein [Rhodospirillales bacterium]MDH3968665.1 PLP-dependent aspartate aminotransferase family protein [Rhodospirillales bacterium]
MKKSNRQAGLRTTAIHAGEAPDPATGASAPNLVMSTTYVLDKPLGFSAQDLGDEAPFIYTRWGNPTVRQLEDKLAALEGAEAGLCFASGMAASAAVLLGVLGAGDHLVVSDTNYAGTAELVRKTLPRLGIAVTPVDASDLAAVKAALRPETRLIWTETPANPILRLSDIAALATLAQKAGVKLAVDSTFATPVATRPLDLGADFVVHALTKYVGGHGDALGGAVLGRKADLDALHLEATVHHGGVLSPFNAWLILRGAATLPLRMAAHEAGALEVARFLEGHAKVAKVLYPGLPSHPQHDLAKRQMTNFSGMIAFQVTGDGPALAARMAESLEIVHYAVSLGHHRSLIYWIGTDDLMASSFALEGTQLAAYRAFAGDGVFRLSVGLEDPPDLCRDLAGVLAGA